MRRLLVSLLFLLTAAAVNAQDLRLDYERESLLGTYRHYTQYVDGLPVLGGEVIERVAHDGSVRELHRAIATRAPKRSLIAKSTAVAAAPVGDVRDAELVAVNMRGAPRPAWRAIAAQQPPAPPPPPL